MSLRRTLARVVLWRGAYLLSSFILNVFFVRYYGAAGSSAVYYLVNIYSFVLLIAGCSLESGMSFFLAKGQADEGSLSLLSLLWTLVFSFLGLGMLQGYFHFFDKDVSADLFGISATSFIPGQLLITFFTALFYTRESPVLPNTLLLSVNLLLILLIPSAGILQTPITSQTYIRLYFWGILLQGTLLALVFATKYGKSFSLPDRAVFQRILYYSLIALSANILFFLVYRVDYWFVKKYCTPEQLGNYIQVSKLGQIALLMPGMLASIIFPATALGKTKGMVLALKRMFGITLLLFCLGFIILLYTGPRIYTTIFGSSMDQMYLPMLLLLPGIFSLSVLTLLSAYFGGMHRPDINAWSAFAGLVVIIAGDLLVIPRYKIAGAAAVSSLGYSVCMLYSLTKFIRLSKSASVDDNA